MRRHYDVASYERLIANVMARMPECGLGSDMLVGFPGETEAHFERTIHVVERLPFSYLHVFSYSARPGRPPPSILDQVHPAVTKARSQRLRELAQAKKKVFARAISRPASGTSSWRASAIRQRHCLSGLTEKYIRVHVDAPEASVNQLVSVRLVERCRRRGAGRMARAQGTAVSRKRVLQRLRWICTRSHRADRSGG